MTAPALPQASFAAAPRRRGDLSLSGFLSSGLVAAALIVGTYWMSQQEESARSWVAHTEEVLAAVGSMRTHMMEMQNSVRGYVITGDEADLAPYESARAQVHDDVRRLAELTADNPPQQNNVRLLEADLEPRLQAAQAVIGARRSGGYEAGRETLATTRAASRSSGMRNVLDGMETQERQLLAQRLAQHQSRLRAFWSVMVVTLLAMVAALATLYMQIRQRRALEEELLAREQEFHLMTDSVTEYAILMLDPQGNVRSWNAGAERIKGYQADEILGRHFSCFYPPEEQSIGKPAQSLRRAIETGVSSGEGWRVRKDGSRFWASVTITPVRGPEGEVTGFCKITRDLTERKSAEDLLRHEVRERTRIDEELQRANARLEAQVEERTRELRTSNAQLSSANDRLEQLSSQLMSAQEEERRHIARELHDETGQALTLIRLSLADLPRVAPAAADAAAQSIQHVDRAIKHIRSLSVRLRPSVLDDLGLPDAIEWLVEQQSKAAGWRVRLDVPELDNRLPDRIETACFRICQEALTNAGRYAHAKEVSVSVHASYDELLMEVADDGNGFDLQQYRTPEERKKHFGLVSMTERAALAGGELEIDTAPGRGTRVRARFPLRPQAAG